MIKMKKGLRVQEVSDRETINARLPKVSKGKKFDRFLRIHKDDVIAGFENVGRADVRTQQEISEYVELIENGEYHPQGHRPPVINKDGKLIAGHVRHGGYMGSNQDYMWVALCDFEDGEMTLLDGTKVNVAGWNYNALVENSTSDTVSKKVSTISDLVKTTKQAIMGKQCGSGKKEIKDWVKDNIKGKNDRELEIIWKRVQHSEGYSTEIERVITPTIIENEFNKLNPSVEMYDTTSSISIGDNIAISERLQKAIRVVQEGKDYSTVIKVKGTKSAKHLNEERKRLEKEMNIAFFYDTYKPFFDAYENDKGKLGTITLHFVKQWKMKDEWVFNMVLPND